MTDFRDDLAFVRRISNDPKVDDGGDKSSMGDKSCPDVWELSDGSYAVVGYTAPKQLLDSAPHDFYFDDGNEHIVVVPAAVLKAAAHRL